MCIRDRCKYHSHRGQKAAAYIGKHQWNPRYLLLFFEEKRYTQTKQIRQKYGSQNSFSLPDTNHLKVSRIVNRIAGKTADTSCQKKIDPLGLFFSGKPFFCQHSLCLLYTSNNDKTSGSSKNKKAKELGIPILSEEDFLSLTKEDFQAE